MTFSPEYIQNKEFNVRFRGFDAEEVDEFLEKVAEQYLLLQVEKKKYKERVAELEVEMTQLKEEQNSFQKAFLSAQKIAEEIQEKGRRESEEMLEAAREEIDLMRAKAEKECKDLEDETDRLKGVKAEIIADLRKFLQAHIERLDNGDTLNPPVLADVNDANEVEESVVDDDPGEITHEEAPGIDPVQDEAEDAEIEDLYQKIDLPDIDDSLTSNEQENNEQEEESAEPYREEHANLYDSISARLKENKEEPATIPDMDGDMLFRLEDPLEEKNEPAVVLDDEEKKS